MKFQNFASASSQCIMISNTLNKITWVNDALTNLTGYTFDAAIGMQDFKLFTGEETELVHINALKSCVCDLNSIKKEMVLYHKSGQQIRVELSKEPIYNNVQKLSGFLVTISDISHKKSISTDATIKAISAAYQFQQQVTTNTQPFNAFAHMAVPIIKLPQIPLYQKLKVA